MKISKVGALVAASARVSKIGFRQTRSRSLIGWADWSPRDADRQRRRLRSIELATAMPPAMFG